MLLLDHLHGQLLHQTGKKLFILVGGIVNHLFQISSRLAEFYCERLKTLVTTHNLGKVTLNHNQLKTGRFVASIKVGQDMFITYPKDFENLTDAYEDAAEQAVNHFEATPVWMQPI